ncbi:MAG: hypothetical protein DWQ01_20135 [Planctomycetota bacterium]|nr:MAG: hypothetical protein DWQ01_20135 [Planctomycetota bacterium]
MSKVKRIAMWCAPRTVSTALLRSFVQRMDTTGLDEPLYAHYLTTTGKQHPMNEEVLAAQSQDWREVLEGELLGYCPTPVLFVKHMAHHLVGDVDFQALNTEDSRHAFLIRHPRELLPSLLLGLGKVEQEDTAYGQQAELFDFLKENGRPPVVVDSKDIQEHPEAMLKALCQALDLPFDASMLSWVPGRHPAYGVWAPHWYANVEKSSGFQPYRPKTEPFPESLQSLYEWALPLYEKMAAVRLRPLEESERS